MPGLSRKIYANINILTLQTVTFKNYSTSCLESIFAGVFLITLNNGNNPTTILNTKITRTLKPTVFMLPPFC